MDRAEVYLRNHRYYTSENVFKHLCYHATGEIADTYLKSFIPDDEKRKEWYGRAVFFSVRQPENLAYFLSKVHSLDVTPDQLIREMLEKMPNIFGHQSEVEQDTPRPYLRYWLKEGSALLFHWADQDVGGDHRVTCNGEEMALKELRDPEQFFTIMLRSFYKKETGSCELICKRQADSWRPNSDLLHLAFLKGAFPLVDILMDHGAFLSAKKYRYLVQFFQRNLLPGAKKRLQKAIQVKNKKLRQHAQTLARISADLQKLLK